jgi:hypothetical protein
MVVGSALVTVGSGRLVEPSSPVVAVVVTVAVAAVAAGGESSPQAPSPTTATPPATTRPILIAQTVSPVRQPVGAKSGVGVVAREAGAI